MNVRAVSLLAALLAACAAPVKPGPAAPQPVRVPDLVRVRVLRATDAPAVGAFRVRPTVAVAAAPSLDLDARASIVAFTRARDALAQGRLPDPDDVRVESFLCALGRPPARTDAPLLVSSPSRRGYDLLLLAPDEGRLRHTFDPEQVERYRVLGYDGAASPAHGDQAAADCSPWVLVEVKRTVFTRAEAPALPLPQAPAPVRLAVAAAAFAEKLRGAYWARASTYDGLLAQLDGLSGHKADTLRTMMRRAAALDRRPDPWEPVAPMATLSFDELPVLP